MSAKHDKCNATCKQLTLHFSPFHKLLNPGVIEDYIDYTTNS